MNEDPTPATAAGTIAERFFTLCRERRRLTGKASIYLFHDWPNVPGETRELLTGVFEQLIREASEAREEWTREFVRLEAARMLEALEHDEDRERFFKLGRTPFLSQQPRPLEPREHRPDVDRFPRVFDPPAPPLSEILRPEDWPTVPGAEPRRDCTGAPMKIQQVFRLLVCSKRARGCQWNSSTHYSRPGDACTNPAGCSGVFEEVPEPAEGSGEE
jgi:hypothetical protein